MAFTQFTEAQAAEIRRLMSEGFKYPEAVRMAVGVSSLQRFGYGEVIEQQEALRQRVERVPRPAARPHPMQQRIGERQFAQQRINAREEIVKLVWRDPPEHWAADPKLIADYRNWFLRMGPVPRRTVEAEIQLVRNMIEQERRKPTPDLPRIHAYEWEECMFRESLEGHPVTCEANPQTVKDRLIRHIGTTLKRKESMLSPYTAPRELTQEGMAQALGLTKAHVAGDLADLVRAGFVSAPTRRHPVPDGRARFTYELTPKGWERYRGLALA